MKILNRFLASLGISVVLVFFGTSLIFAGGKLNNLVREANHERMPVENYLDLYKLEDDGMDMRHELLTPETRYKVLCDVIPMPYFTENGEVRMGEFSAGDVVIESGELTIALSSPISFLIVLRYGKKRRKK